VLDQSYQSRSSLDARTVCSRPSGTQKPLARLTLPASYVLEASYKRNAVNKLRRTMIGPAPNEFLR